MMEDGRGMRDNGKWKMDNGQWTMENGVWGMRDDESFINLSIFLLFFVFFGFIFLDDEVVDDEFLSLHGVLAHIVFEEFGDLV